MFIKVLFVCFSVQLSIASPAPQGISFAVNNRGKLGSSCKTRDSRPGVCRFSNRCSRSLLTGANQLPNICSFVGTSKTIICCPTTQSRPRRPTKSEQVIGSVSRPPINFECGRKGKNGNRGSVPDRKLVLNLGTLVFTTHKPVSKNENRTHIVGGEDANPNEWPWMALFGKMQDGKNTYFCDGAVINSRFILTAAHCLLSTDPFYVRLGEHNSDEQSKAINVDVKKIIIHPEYRLRIAHHDIALVEIVQPINFKSNRIVQPVCLPWNSLPSSDLVGRKVTVTGWGALQFGGPSHPVLQEVEVDVFDSKKCHISYSKLAFFSRRYPDGLDNENTVCAGVAEGGKDACQGDSGGPMVIKENGRWTMAAVVSQGYGCGNKDFFGLYAPVRTRKYLQWIKDVAFA